MNTKTITLFALLSVTGCQGGVLNPDDLVDGTFRYRGLANSETLLVEGTVVIDFQPADASGAIPFTGTWETREVVLQTAVRVGPQIGEGTLVGWITDGEVFANMNPENADNNVYLSGNLFGSRFRGRWSYSTFVGEVDSGRFELMRER